MSDREFEVTVSERTIRKFSIIGERFNIPNANECFEKICDMVIEQINLKLAIEANESFSMIAEDWMLHPSSFDGATAVFGPPTGMTEDEVFSLCAARLKWGDDRAILTCWKPTRDQLDAISQSGRVWLTVMGQSMPPVALTSENPTLFDGIDLL